jgi:hypothetical protein
LILQQQDEKRKQNKTKQNKLPSVAFTSNEKVVLLKVWKLFKEAQKEMEIVFSGLRVVGVVVAIGTVGVSDASWSFQVDDGGIDVPTEGIQGESFVRLEQERTVFCQKKMSSKFDKIQLPVSSPSKLEHPGIEKDKFEDVHGEGERQTWTTIEPEHDRICMFFFFFVNSAK